MSIIQGVWILKFHSLLWQMFSFTKAEVAFKYYTLGKHKANIQTQLSLLWRKVIVWSVRNKSFNRSFIPHSYLKNSYFSSFLFLNIISNLRCDDLWNHIYSILRAAIICTKIRNYDSVPVTSKLVKWHTILSLKLTLVSADLKVQDPVAMVRNNRPRLWIKRSLTGSAMSNPAHCTANTGQSVQPLSVKEKGLPRTCQHPGMYHKGQKEWLSFILSPAQQFSHLWVLRPLHTVGREYPLAGAQLQHPPLHTAELQHGKESKKTALSTAPLHRLKVLIYLPSWHSCSLICALNRQEETWCCPDQWGWLTFLSIFMYPHTALFPSSVLILVYPKKAQSFPLWSSKPGNK